MTIPHAPLLALLTAACLLCPARAQAPAAPLPQAHAHNDYEHARPLWDALDHGFTSVEADIYLVDGQLLIAHDRQDVRPERTLERLYLAPLRERTRAHGRHVYNAKTEFTLLIDLKTAAEPTYAALRPLLERYRELLTVFRPGETRRGAVTVILSGERPRALLEQQLERLAAIDGRLEDLGTGASPHLVPLVSDRWGKAFTWAGVGPFPEEQRRRLRETAAQAHREGYRLRFWATPELPSVWKELRGAGVDLIGTDDLGKLAGFLRAESAS